MARKPAFISHSREREAQIQGRMLDVLERRFARQIAEAIVQESDEILSGYRDLGYVPPASDDAARCGSRLWAVGELDRRHRRQNDGDVQIKTPAASSSGRQVQRRGYAAFMACIRLF